MDQAGRNNNLERPFLTSKASMAPLCLFCLQKPEIKKHEFCSREIPQPSNVCKSRRCKMWQYTEKGEKTSLKPKSNNAMWIKFGIAWCVTETGPMNAVLWNNFSSNGGSRKLLRYCFEIFYGLAKNVIPGNSGLQCIKITKQKCRDEETA